MEKRFAAGEILLREGDPSEGVVLVRAGVQEGLTRAVGDLLRRVTGRTRAESAPATKS